MYCPRCAQQCQGDVRFCARCGLQLSLIAQITSNEGLMTAADNAPKPLTRSQRQKGIRVGTILILASVVISPLFFALSIMADAPGPLLAPLTVFLTGLSVVLYSRAFGDPIPPAVNQAYQLNQPINRPAFPLPDRPSVEGFAPRQVNTADMSEPTSVTDHTTQLFD
jgi:hypothetical protein